MQIRKTDEVQPGQHKTCFWVRMPQIMPILEQS